MDVRFFPHPAAQQASSDLVGKCANFHYASGNVLQQEWISDTSIIWRGVSGDFTGVEQTEHTLRVFKTGEQQYLITWHEEGTVATAAQGTVYAGSYPVAVFADFKAMTATAAYSNPAEDGGVFYTVDQATIEWVNG